MAKALVTSFRMSDLDALQEQAHMSSGAGQADGCHTVIVVDASGSMRKNDVSGFESRTEAVYDCLERDFLAPQLANPKEGDNLVSLLEMSDETKVIFKRMPVGESVRRTFSQRKKSRAHSHGNYVPALDALTDLLLPEMNTQRRILIMVLSDGAPSDHVTRECIHGSLVWKESNDGRMVRGRPALIKQQSSQCRTAVVKSVATDCVQKIVRLGDLLGRDRTSIMTCAFGPLSEDFETLQKMSKALPKGSFQKLGLNPNLLSSAFSSLSSSLTSLMTEGGGGGGLTERKVVREDPYSMGTGGWDFYPLSSSSQTERACLKKEKWSMHIKGFVPAEYGPGVHAVLHSRRIFGSGAERQVYHFYEVQNAKKEPSMTPVGIQLTAKQPRHCEYVNDDNYMRQFCRVQATAQELALHFNKKVQGKPSWHISFVECCIYTLRDWSLWEGGKGTVLVEPYLEGKFTKWNNNAGYIKGPQQQQQRSQQQQPQAAAAGEAAAPRAAPRVFNLFRNPPALPLGGARGGASGQSPGLFGIGEEDEDEGDDAGGGGRPAEEGREDIEPDHVPQAFSHFTFASTHGRSLVCDLQGVWNATDGFMLTDPVIHHASRKGKNGRTDKGRLGIKKFFDSHKCNSLCAKLGLSMPKAGPDGHYVEETAGGRQPEGQALSKECVVCMAKERTHVLVPCGHARLCSDCAGKMSRCPDCRQPVVQAIRLFE